MTEYQSFAGGGNNCLLNSLVRHRYSILLVVSFLLITLMTLWTPFFYDDWHFCFIYEKDGMVMQRPIQTLTDLFESLHNYYLYKDGGRCVANGTAMVFLAFFGHNVFAVCNGVMFALMLHLFCLNFAGKRENYFTVASIVLTYTVLFLPEFSHAMLWLDGSCNYLWSAVFILLFHYLLNKDIRKLWWPLLFIYGIIAGNTNEGIMIGLSVGYMAYYLKHFKELTPQRWVMLIGLAIGVALLVFSPGAWNRATAQGTTAGTTTIFTEGPRFLIKHLPKYFIALRITYIAVFLMFYRKKFPLLWGSAMIPLALLCLLVQCGSDTTYFGLELCSLAVVLQLLDIERIKSRYVVAMVVVPILVLLTALPLCAKNYSIFREGDEAVKNSADKCVLCFLDTEVVTVPYISGRFVIVNPWDYYLINKGSFLILRYYGKDEIRLFPTVIKDDIMTGKIGKEFDLHSPYPYYVCEWDGSDEVVGKMTYTPSPYAKYPLLNRIGKFTLTEQDIAGSYLIQTINGKRYLFIEKNQPIADRIKSIEVHSKED